MAESYERFLPFMDVRDGLKRVMGKETLYRNLLRRFDVRKWTDELLALIEVGDHAAVIKKAHAIKGVAANLGLTPLRSLMQETENCGKAGADYADLTERVAALRDDTERVLQEFIGLA